jgi:hypothetical protein
MVIVCFGQLFLILPKNLLEQNIMLTTIHRFTPPTCTLEIAAKSLFLGRWSDRKVRQKFKLSFDDPRVPRYKQISIKGDRHSLEQLKTSVDNYLQKFLANSLLFDQRRRETVDPNIQHNNYNTDNSQPYFQSKGLTEHELFFGNLSHDHTENKTTLSTVQLFDLITALEAFFTQISTLPQSKQTKFKIISLWSLISASVLAVVGITAVLLKPSQKENTTISPQLESSDTIPVPQLDDVVPPETSTTSKKTPQPKTNKSLSSATKLPPPPAVDAPKPKPNIPDPADYPLATVARQSGLNKPVKQKNPLSVVPPETNAPKNFSSARKTESNLDNSSNNSLEKSDVANINHNDDLALKSPPAKFTQLQEIKAYFQTKWQPPGDLKQSLEYRLYLNSDGSIARVIPLGKASELYLSKTNIPVQGETFISSFEQDKSPQSTIRLLLNPDGGVETFAEESNL